MGLSDAQKIAVMKLYQLLLCDSFQYQSFHLTLGLLSSKTCSSVATRRQYLPENLSYDQCNR
ncbi:hypothetical protein AWB65_02268 [Caballeronia humi]|uniref:Uncharacterized protein n=1 Tax=Caballeronia humi TaxID=326474 RepID=A0A158GN22_9BURK|nr:hypothetical protein AWB65_02268 [Caballeronia humi]